MSSDFDPMLSELMRRAQGGDQDAFAELLEKIRPRLSSYLKKQLFNVSEWEDLY